MQRKKPEIKKMRKHKRNIHEFINTHKKRIHKIMHETLQLHYHTQDHTIMSCQSTTCYRPPQKQFTTMVA